MSATTRHIPLHRLGSRPAPNAPAPALAIAWAISPRALVAAPAAAALLNGHAARLVACVLVWTIDDETASAWLELTVAGGERDGLVLVERGAVVRVEDAGAGLVHIDVPGLLRATLRPGPDGVEILFARTTLLNARLGLPGGVYDRPELNDAE